MDDNVQKAPYGKTKKSDDPGESGRRADKEGGNIVHPAILCPQ
ncbi:MAG: hypothetical protein ACYC9K_03245 [Sulfuricaulis sp.]